MKKVLLGLLFIVIIAVSYLIYKELSFSPLKECDFQKMFKKYDGKPRKSCSKDFLGASIHGEYFEIYLYKTKNAVINKDFPDNINEWEQNTITDATIIGKWKNCPIDSQTAALYESSMLKANNLNDVKCSSSIKKDIINPNNFYSYIYFSESEEYFLLYCTDRQELWYIRLRL